MVRSAPSGTMLTAKRLPICGGGFVAPGRVGVVRWGWGPGERLAPRRRVSHTACPNPTQPVGPAPFQLSLRIL